MRNSFANIYSRVFVLPSEDCFATKREYIGTENIDFEGRAVQSSAIKIDDPKNRYKGMRADDFCLENQQSLGVSLNPVRLSLVNSFEEDSQIK